MFFFLFLALHDVRKFLKKYFQISLTKKRCKQRFLIIVDTKLQPLVKKLQFVEN